MILIPTRRAKYDHKKNTGTPFSPATGLYTALPTVANLNFSFSCSYERLSWLPVGLVALGARMPKTRPTPNTINSLLPVRGERQTQMPKGSKTINSPLQTEQEELRPKAFITWAVENEDRGPADQNCC